jgi:hypothetical protein
MNVPCLIVEHQGDGDRINPIRPGASDWTREYGRPRAIPLRWLEVAHSVAEVQMDGVNIIVKVEDGPDSSAVGTPVAWRSMP